MKNKIFFNSKDHTLYQGNCIKVIKKIKKKFKLIFADPPYNMGKNFGNNKDKWETIIDYRNWCKEWINVLITKLDENGSLLIMGHPRYSSYLVPYLDEKLNYVNQIVFFYSDGMPEKKNFERRYEMILYYRKNKDKYIFNIDPVRVPLVRYEKTSNKKGKNPNDVWQINRVRWNSKEREKNSNGKIAHLAQKPLRLMRRIILATTNSGDNVLDPFIGTGTTSVACKELSRKSVGIEININYLKIAKKRLEKTKKNNLFNPDER